MLNLGVLLSKNDLRRGLCLPQQLSKELAEEIGIHVGDGCLRMKKYSYQAKYVYEITSNKNERDYLEGHVIPLIKKLYNLAPKIRTNHNALSCYLLSKGVCEFKKSIGLPVGRKDHIEIPKLVLDSFFITDFLRGLFDTDGYLRFLDRNKHPNRTPIWISPAKANG